MNHEFIPQNGKTTKEIYKQINAKMKSNKILQYKFEVIENNYHIIRRQNKY